MPVRDGTIPLGGADAVVECAGAALLAGSGTADAAPALAGLAASISCVELGDFRPHQWAVALAPIITATPVVVLPASPDGRDLAPHLAHVLRRPLVAGALELTATSAVVVADGGHAVADVELTMPVVVTLQPAGRDRQLGRGGDLTVGATPAVVSMVELAAPAAVDAGVPVFEALLEADATSIDLGEASRIVSAGGGLDDRTRIDQLQVVAGALGAAVGATRVVTDRGWVGHRRQIGTTGVVVDPALYVAFGVSGAVQHTAGLGDPAHVVSVNVDPHCPMMQLADLAIVADANAVLDELAARLGADNG